MAAPALEVPAGLAIANRLNVELAEWQSAIQRHVAVIDTEKDILRRACESYGHFEAQLKEAQETDKEIKKEVDLWKKAYNQENRRADEAEEIVKQAVNEIRLLEERIKVLGAQVAASNPSPKTQDRESMVLALIDGDGYIFSDELLQRGREGGLEAAQILNESIINHVTGSMAQPGTPNSNKLRSSSPSLGQVQVWTYVFFNMKGLKQAVVGANICSVDEFEGFMTAFNQANPRLLVNDVHSGKEAADAKIKAYLQSWTSFPQMSRIYFGGAHDNGYYPTLAELHNNNLLDKLVLLQGYEQMAHEIASLRLPVLSIGGLFRTEKIPRMLATNVNGALSPKPSTQSPPLGECSPNSGGNLNATAESFYPTFAAQLMAPPDSPGERKFRQINPKLKLHKHVPPPCNMFYLSTCIKGADCKYAHDYLLEPEHYETLRQFAKKSACPAVNSNSPCPFEENCVHGHKCPHGPQCYHKKLNRCWFRGKDMHS